MIILYLVGIQCNFSQDFFGLFHIISAIIYILTWIGFISHFGHIYTKISNDQNLVLAKQIQSDAFINNFLEEFISKTSKVLSEWVIGIFTISIISNIIGFAFLANN